MLIRDGFTRKSSIYSLPSEKSDAHIVLKKVLSDIVRDEKVEVLRSGNSGEIKGRFA